MHATRNRQHTATTVAPENPFQIERAKRREFRDVNRSLRFAFERSFQESSYILNFLPRCASFSYSAPCTFVCNCCNVLIKARVRNAWPINRSGWFVSNYKCGLISWKLPKVSFINFFLSNRKSSNVGILNCTPDY